MLNVGYGSWLFRGGVGGKCGLFKDGCLEMIVCIGCSEQNADEWALSKQ